MAAELRAFDADVESAPRSRARVGRAVRRVREAPRRVRARAHTRARARGVAARARARARARLLPLHRDLSLSSRAPRSQALEVARARLCRRAALAGGARARDPRRAAAAAALAGLGRAGAVPRGVAARNPSWHCAALVAARGRRSPRGGGAPARRAPPLEAKQARARAPRARGAGPRTRRRGDGSATGRAVVPLGPGARRARSCLFRLNDHGARAGTGELCRARARARSHEVHVVLVGRCSPLRIAARKSVTKPGPGREPYEHGERHARARALAAVVEELEDAPDERDRDDRRRQQEEVARRPRQGREHLADRPSPPPPVLASGDENRPSDHQSSRCFT